MCPKGASDITLRQIWILISYCPLEIFYFICSPFYISNFIGQYYQILLFKLLKIHEKIYTVD